MAKVWECGVWDHPHYRVTDDERCETYVLQRMDSLHGRRPAAVNQKGGYRTRDEIAADILWDWCQRAPIVLGCMAAFCLEFLRPISGSTRFDVTEEDLERWFMLHLYETCAMGDDAEQEDVNG